MSFAFPEEFKSPFEHFEGSFASYYEGRYHRDNPIDPVIRYILAGPGKRTRALLCMLSAKTFKAERQAVLPAIAIEMVHAYSLVHDDLPCMDDDDLRRGRPTAHVKFDEASALLAGDGILTDAFGLLADLDVSPFAELQVTAAQRLALLHELCSACGSRGMVVGQALDLYWTGKGATSREVLDQIHLNKTGALIGAACAMGAIVGGASEQEVSAFRTFGSNIGLAFQIIDDLVDDKEGTGKSKGKDEQAGKLTYLRLMSIEEAMNCAQERTTFAIETLRALQIDTVPVIRFSQALLERNF
jgi:geranylgeranyl diphosphate synthase, type II